jgi:hypothetical protein
MTSPFMRPDLVCKRPAFFNEQTLDGDMGIPIHPRIEELRKSRDEYYGLNRNGVNYESNHG